MTQDEIVRRLAEAIVILWSREDFEQGDMNAQEVAQVLAPTVQSLLDENTAGVVEECCRAACMYCEQGLAIRYEPKWWLDLDKTEYVEVWLHNPTGKGEISCSASDIRLAANPSALRGRDRLLRQGWNEAVEGALKVCAGVTKGKLGDKWPAWADGIQVASNTIAKEIRALRKGEES